MLAQQVIGTAENLAGDRPEAWIMKRVGSELQMNTGVPANVRPGAVELGLGTGWLPSLDTRQRRIGFNGQQEENVNRTPAFLRPRISLGLPAQLSLALGYIPPIRIGGIRPNHFSWSVGRPVASGSWWRVGARVHGQIGNLRGDITCDKETVAAGQDPVGNPFGCEAPSDDEMRIRAVGLEMGGAFRTESRFEPYVTVGWNHFHNEFQVNARYSGMLDRTLLLSSGSTVAMTGGASYRISDRIKINGAAFYTPLQVRRQGLISTDGLFNLRVSLFYTIR
jgi:opacity protein-like surface antigen